jgi:hypothetical protein
VSYPIDLDWPPIYVNAVHAGEAMPLTAISFDKPISRHEHHVDTLFRFSCITFEELHGERAANDFRGYADRPGAAKHPRHHIHDAARVASRGGKESREEALPRRAPSVDNARIGAPPL